MFTLSLFKICYSLLLTEYKQVILLLLEYKFTTVTVLDYNNYKYFLHICLIIGPYLPCLFHEDFKAVWAGGGYRKVKTVAANTPNDGWRVNIFVGNLSSQQFP